MEYMPWKDAGNEQSLPKKDVMWALASKATGGGGIPKPVGAFIMILYAPDMDMDL
jgi:hypothetical protein